jgi:hypothetical protein
MAVLEIVGGAVLGMLILYLIALACRFFIYKSKNDTFPGTKEGFNIFTLKKCDACPTCPTCAPATPCPSPSPTPTALKAGDACTKPVNNDMNALTYKYDKNMNCAEVASCKAATPAAGTAPASPGYFPHDNACKQICTVAAGSPTPSGAKTMVTTTGGACSIVAECLGSNVLVNNGCYEPCDTLASGTIANSKKYYKTGTPSTCNRVYECNDGYMPNEAGTGGTPAAGTSCVPATETYTMKDLVEHYLIHG